MASNEFHHETVLLDEAVEELIGDDSGIYVDATFGRGGHSEKILQRLSGEGVLIAIDKDPEAVKVAEKRFGSDPRFRIFHGSFAELKSFLAAAEVKKVDGVLADLGVSSPQLDEADRGFSFMSDGPLDMRMNPEAGQSAAEWLREVSEQELAKVLKEYGEERFAKRIARAVVDAARDGELDTTAKLAKVVSDANPAWEKHKHPATRAFQGIRIAINNELGDLKTLLDDAASALAVGGRLAVISFHSLEDRIVKRFMREKVKGDTPPPGVPVFERDIPKQFCLKGKAVKPTAREVENNIRARSAVMRVLEKIADE